MKSKLICIALLIFSALILRAQSSFAQTAEITGKITDSSGAVIPDAAVTVTNLETGIKRNTASSGEGYYTISLLQPAEYKVVVQKPGFKTLTRANIKLVVGQVARVDFTLELGELAQTMEVSAGTPLIETETATQGTVIDNQRIIQLPLNGRNFQQLAVLGPGVIAPVPGSGDRVSVAGARGLGTSFLMDGTTNSNTNANVAMINPSIDLIQEFKVMRNTFNAEFGHGAAQINLVTRTGTNQFRLTLFEFLRNDKMQARNFFDQQKPALRRNQFGGTVSGPLVLPKIYDGRNRSFWLFNYEGVRERTPSTIRATVPTQAELSGDLSTVAGPLNDPLTGQPFPGRRIPASRINSASRNYQQFMPATDLPRGTFGGSFNFIRAGSALDDSYQTTLRFDHNFSSDTNVFARYTVNDRSTLPLGILPIYPRASYQRQQNATLGHNHVFRPNLINEFRFGFARHNNQLTPGAVSGGKNFAAEVGLNNLLSASMPSAYSPPTVSIVGFTSLGGGILITQRANTFSFVDNVSYIRGRHSLKFGADIRRLLHDTRNIGPTNGSFSFQGTFSGNPLGDFLLGIPRNANGTAPPGVDGVNLATLWQGFAQDDWKATSNLTLSFGLRYEYYTPWINNRDRISRFDPDFPGGRVIYPGDSFYFVPGQGFIPTDRPLASRGLYRGDRDDFGPRFGFAWRPFGNNRSSVRGSYGIFVENSNETNHIASIANPPHLLQHNIVNDAASRSVIPWSDMFPAAVTAFSTQISTVAAELPTGYVQQWSLNLERELSENLAVELGYSGSKGTNLDQRLQLNQARLDPDPALRTPIVSRLPFPAFAPGLVAHARTAMSTYHSFISRIERSFSNGLQFLAAYTFSKGIDNSSFSGNIGVQPANAQNAYDVRSEKGLSYFDVPHRLVVSYVWELPIGPGRKYLSRHGTAGKIIGGWRISGISQFQSGNPWSILVSSDVANVGTTGQAAFQRADLVGDPYPEGFRRGGPGRLAFDTRAFARARAGTFGNSGRNIIRDAGINNWDFSVGKDIRLTERTKLEFRAEFFNVWNHTQFEQFVNSIDSPNFGTWNNAKPPRIIQLGLKLNY